MVWPSAFSQQEIAVEHQEKGAILMVRFVAFKRQLLAIAAIRDAGAERLGLVGSCHESARCEWLLSISHYR